MIANGPRSREQILALLSRKDYRPLNKIEIARKLGATSNVLVRSRASARIDTFCRLRPTWLPGSYRFIQLATVFSRWKNRASRTFSLRRKTSAQRCMEIVSLRAYRLKRLRDG